VEQSLPKTDGGSPPHIGNFVFLAGLGQSLLALALSAIILVTSYAFFAPELSAHKRAAGSDAAVPRTFQGSEFQLRMGAGEATEAGELRLTALQEGEDNRAIATRKTSFAAGDYAFVEYEVRGRNAQQAVYLIWRSADTPLKVSSMPLHWHGDHKGTAFLGRQAEWRGRITEIGLDVYGELRGQPLVISKLALLPGSGTKLLDAVWFEWTAFRSWTQKSANFLEGRPKHGILSPTLAMAAWSCLALLLLAGVYLFTGSQNRVAYAGALIIPWVVSDQLWQANLSTQLEETKYLFAGKGQHEKHLADWSPELYEYAQYLKSEVLPEPGPRIFLLHDSEPMTYTRLKAQYYLLPHNVFNYDRFPRKKAARVGDYILVLGTVAGLEFSPDAKALRWQGRSLPVKLIDSRPDGSLFKVTRRKKEQREPSP